MNTAIDPTKLLEDGPAFSQTEESGSRSEALPQAIAPAWNRPQQAALAALKLALNESFVFAAVLGPKGSGKSAVLAEVRAGCRKTRTFYVEIRTPAQLSASTVADIDNRIRWAVESIPSNDVHVVVTVDDAQTASDDLLGLLSRFAEDRAVQCRKQVILAGLPGLLSRLASVAYEQLDRRIAVRCNL